MEVPDCVPKSFRWSQCIVCGQRRGWGKVGGRGPMGEFEGSFASLSGPLPFRQPRGLKKQHLDGAGSWIIKMGTSRSGPRLSSALMTI